jgi:hypothetical protein
MLPLLAAIPALGTRNLPLQLIVPAHERTELSLRRAQLPPLVGDAAVGLLDPVPVRHVLIGKIVEAGLAQPGYEVERVLVVGPGKLRGRGQWSVNGLKSTS